MKKTGFLLAAAFCLLLASGCGQTPPAAAEPSPSAGKLDAVQFSDGQLYAVAWVGYDDLSELPFYLDRYIDGDSVPTHYLSGGDYYLVLPRYSGMELKLYQNDALTGTTSLIFEEKDCKPFLIQCNVSDIFSDALISFTYQGETAEFSPYLSLEDGSVVAGERGLNLTK